MNELVVMRDRNEMVLGTLLFSCFSLSNDKPYIVEVKPKCERIKNVL